MKDRIRQLRQDRYELAKRAEEITKRAAAESRNLTDDEVQTFDQMHADVDALKGEIDRLERQEIVSAEFDQVNAVEPEPDVEPEPKPVNISDGVVRFMRSGLDGLNREERQAFDGTGQSGRQSIFIPQESRAQTTVDAAGGYTIPEGFWPALTEAMLAFGGMRQAATVIRTATGNDLPFPTDNDTGNVGEIIAEGVTHNDQDVTFANVVLQAYKYSSKFIKISLELLQDSAFDLPSWAGRKIGERIGRIQNTHFTVGDGSAKPNGAVTASTLGKTAASATAVTYAELLDLKHSVDPAYRSSAVWMMKDSTLLALKKLVDGNSRPLWQAGMAVGQPDTIDGDRYIINQDMPAMTAGLKSILYGNMASYYIRDVTGMTLIRLDERFAELGVVAFLGFMRADGDLINAGTNPVKHLIQL